MGKGASKVKDNLHTSEERSIIPKNTRLTKKLLVRRLQSARRYHQSRFINFYDLLTGSAAFGFYFLSVAIYCLVNKDKYLVKREAPRSSTIKPFYEQILDKAKETQMGRHHRDVEKKHVRGPGRKAKRQKDLFMPEEWKEKISNKQHASRAKKRQKMRELKKKLKEDLLSPSGTENDVEAIGQNGPAPQADVVEEEIEAKGLKLLSDSDSDNDMIGDDFDGMSDDDPAAEIKEQVLAEMQPDEEEDLSSDDEILSNDDELPIEKKTKAIEAKKAQINKAIQEGNLQTNIGETETFVLPSGQEIEKENILFHVLD
ncbi:unnamed protein product [Clavelina lepadiformis]|uniref:Ribosome biogenesis protein NOP53 n=1 Tax=Clavelina lepadiformis TaxID=159417 RepID=A0ABP0GLA4_CLALP